ncbi:MAG: signal peptidase I [Candidatus Hydrogenedens sp.]|nr:signal peptidase I [Candidatus Hydrogenedens sp.]
MTQTDSAEAAARQHSENRRQTIYWFLIIGSILFVKGFLMDQFTIPSRSMEPTLHGDTFFKGDRILVNRLAYGIRLPWTKTWLAEWGGPERWEVMVFQTIEPDSNHDTLVKRVVGLPGETIQIHHGGILINGKKVEKPDSMPEEQWYWSPDDIRKIADPRQRAFFEELQRQDPIRFGVGNDPASITIPEGHYFMMGDNSSESHDSRMYGFVPRENLVGRAFAIWYPFNRWRDFTGYSHTWWGKSMVIGIPSLLFLWIFWDIATDLRRWFKKLRGGSEKQ